MDTTFSFESEDLDIVIKTNHANLGELVATFANFLRACTYHQESITNAFKEYVEEQDND